MNSDIKFRVFDKINKKYLDPNNTQFAILGNGKLIISTSDWYSEFVNVNQNNYQIEEFTGFVDINNKEIYEGDIINFSLNGQKQSSPAKVIWYDFYCRWGLMTKAKIELCTCKNIEII
jgi:uncharacterized phage protein (TIGR01671 family)